MKKAFLVFSILFSCLLFSCTTIVDSERPSWIDAVPEIPGEKVFVASGMGNSEVEARSNAVLSALSQMGEEIGYSLEEKYFRELFSSLVISDLGARIADEYSWEIDGEWTVFVAVTAMDETFEGARSPEFLEIQKREEEISSLLSSSLDAYKNNRDMEAVEDILQAALISLSGDVKNEEYSPEVLFEKAIKYLSNLRIENVKPSRDTSSSSLEFRVQRTKGLLYPMVENALVECTYSAISLSGDIENLSHLSRTNAKGRFVMNRTNPYALHEGNIKISVHIDDDLMFNLSLKAPKELMASLNKAIDDGSLEYSYSFPPRQDISSVVIALAEYNYDGSMRKEDGALKSVLENLFALQGISFETIVFAEGEEESDNIEALLSQYSHMEKIYVIRMGVVSRINIDDKVYSRAEGKIIEINPSISEKNDVSAFHACVSGSSEKEADENTLEKLSRVICGFLLGEF